MVCDVKGCHRPAYVEVYPAGKAERKHGITNGTWSYLCKKHYKEEYKKHGDNYGWCELSTWEKFLIVIRVYE